MGDPEEVANSFVQQYYHQFAEDRSQLGGLYSQESMLTFEDNRVMGAQNIAQTLANMPFQSVCHVRKFLFVCFCGFSFQHKNIAKTIDVQPTAGNGLLVFVNGDLFIDGGENGVKFAQVFSLQPVGDTFYVLNDIMKLNYG